MSVYLEKMAYLEKQHGLEYNQIAFKYNVLFDGKKN